MLKKQTTEKNKVRFQNTYCILDGIIKVILIGFVNSFCLEVTTLSIQKSFRTRLAYALSEAIEK